jgi:hypothetical protein
LLCRDELELDATRCSATEWGNCPRSTRNDNAANRAASVSASLSSTFVR